MMYKTLIKSLGLILFSFVFITFISRPSYAKVTQIEDIEILENDLKIKIDGSFDNYRVYKNDPFRVIVELEGVDIGRYKEKITPDKGIVEEILLSKIESPLVTKLDIILQYPSNVMTEKFENVLLISFDSLLSDIKKEGVGDKSIATAKEIIAVIFDKTDDGADLIIKGDGSMDEPVVAELEGKVVIEIPNVSMKAPMPSRIPHLIKNIKYEAKKDGVRFILDVNKKVNSDVSIFDDEIVVSLVPSSKNFLEKSVKKENHPKIKNEELISNTKNANLISLDFQDADIMPVIRSIADVSGYNIIVHPDVKGKVTMKLLNVPWQQALDVILKNYGLEKIIEGNVIRVLPRKIYDEELKTIGEMEFAKEMANVESRVFVVNYADVEKAKDTIEKAGIVRKENISVDKRTRSIIVKDTPSNLKAVETLISNLDKPTSQVLIEARIVEVSSTFTRELGIQWGFEWLSSNWRTSLSGSVDTPGSQTGLSPARPSVTGGQFPVAINLPAKDATSAITFGYLNAAQTFGLDLRLSAFQDIGKSRVLSNPRIITSDNQKAQIILGESVPYGEREVSGNQVTISTKFKDVAIIIEVTPQVTTDDVISLNVNAKKEDLRRFVDIGQGTFAPHTDKVEASTSVLIKNGETMVIGGILKKKELDSVSGVPGLMNIPVLGWLFKKKATDESNTEVLIFITPRIIKN